MQCQYIDANGRQCRAKALKGRSECFFHASDPATMKARSQAQFLGGSRSPRKSADLPALDWNFDDPVTIARTFSKIAELVYYGQLPVKRVPGHRARGGRCLARLGGRHD